MEKVELVVSHPPVTISDLKETDSIGFIDNGNQKGFICYLGFEWGKICAYGNNEYAYNGLKRYKTLKLAVESLSGSNVTCYRFESMKGLYKWLSED